VSPISGLPQPTVAPTDPEPPAALPPEQMREILRRFATGVTVLAAGHDVPQGMTANAFTSVSLSPPLVLVCVSKSAAIHQTILNHQSFAVSVLSGRQEYVARYFADHSRPRGREEFDVVGWSHGPNTGSPIIHGALAWMECELRAVHEGGDHSIFVGSVLAGEHGIARDALLFLGGAFHTSALANC
jgi:flavin reductase (DIM6/NTAB) family NADH-FMN oxidoreductase RutF